MESKVKDGNYLVIQSFMVKDLKLKGNELLVYAIIYGFSQDGESVFNGGLSYLAEWTNSTKQGVIKTLKTLIEKGYIDKKKNTINGIKFCEYYTKFNGGKQSLMGGKQSLMGGKQSLPNNISNNINNNISKESNINITKERLTDFDEIIARKTSKPEIVQALKDFVQMRKAIRKPMTPRALELLLNRLETLSGKSADLAVKILNQSILNSWQDIYSLREPRKEPKQTKPISYEVDENYDGV